jgi:hypothetical protein
LFVYAITAADGLAVGAAAPASRLALSATIAAAIMIHKASHGLHFVVFSKKKTRSRVTRRHVNGRFAGFIEP